jgi:Zn-dependent peptidase ImmA (M78 family)/DNA-binding XRE family transcriptional regulator
MLIIARESREMVQKDLAEAISVTQGKISKYENGLLVVSDDDLGAISKALRYTREFFYQTDGVHGLGSSFLFHRQRAQVPVLIQRKVQASVNILRMQLDRLLRGGEIETQYSFAPIDIDAHNGDAEKIAAIVRAAWRLPLGPVANVTASIEAAGGVIMVCRFGTDMIDAAHFWLPGLPPLFFVNQNMPGDRLRWTLAHEIGHAIMHRTPTEAGEDEANRFASEFLMPREEIAHQLDGMTLQRAAILKQTWKVSMAAIIRRAFDLGRISERKYRSLNTSLSAQGYKKNEPYPVAVEEPGTVRKLVQMHRMELGYDDFDLARLLFSDDPQYFAPQERPALMSVGGKPFFAFFKPPQDRRFSI